MGRSFTGQTALPQVPHSSARACAPSTASSSLSNCFSIFDFTGVPLRLGAATHLYQRYVMARKEANQTSKAFS